MKDEDKTFENERKHMNEPVEDRGALDLTYLIEEHKKEIWEYKQKEADWIKTDNILQGSKKIINELSTKLVEQTRVISNLNYRIVELEKQLADKNK
jgi:hypothetical protein|tara:strand:- start:742 stop:1029 length:288 start_codon:yes stop_codon:yes gene_type:complete